MYIKINTLFDDLVVEFDAAASSLLAIVFYKICLNVF